jgi:hypothetical protein
MLRLLAAGLAGALVLGGAASEKPRLTKAEYLTALTRITIAPATDGLEARVIDFDLPGAGPASRRMWLQSERRLRSETERVADQVEALRPPADVEGAQAAYVSSLRFCAGQLARLERASPIDPVIVERELQPCFAAHRRACERYFERHYSWG